MNSRFFINNSQELGKLMIFIIILFLGFCIIDYFESLNKPTKADIMKQRRIRKEAREKRAYIERLYLERIALGI